MILEKYSRDDLRTLHMLLPRLHMAYYHYIDNDTQRTRDTHPSYLALYTVT